MNPGRRRLVAVVAALGAAQALAVFLYLRIEEGRAAGGAPVRFERLPAGRPLPDLALVGPGGEGARTLALRGGPVLVHFWATWCAPCREELPALLRRARATPGLRLVAVSVDQDWEQVRRFFDGEIPPEVVREPSGALVRHYGVSGLPDGYLLDPDGVARARLAGARDWSDDAARVALEQELSAIEGRP